MPLRFLGLERAEWWFWLLWALASVAGFAVAAGAGTSAFLGDADPLVGTAVVGAGGAVAGMLQWFLLRQRVRRSGWWTLSSTMFWAGGAIVAFTVGMMVNGGVVLATHDDAPVLIPTAVGLVFVGVVCGAVGAPVVVLAGTLLWLILRRRVRGSGWWVLTSALALAAAAVVGMALGVIEIAVKGVDHSNLVGVVNPAVGTAMAVGVAGVGCLAASALTGLLLVLVLRRPIEQSSEAEA